MKAIGYWVFEVEVMDEPPIIKFDEGDEIPDPSDSGTVNTQLVYKKVTVDVSDNTAYYSQSDIGPDMDLYRLRERGGKVYVPIEQVHRTPPKDAKPYHEVKE